MKEKADFLNPWIYRLGQILGPECEFRREHRNLERYGTLESVAPVKREEEEEEDRGQKRERERERG
ncbi:hypothetical protein SO802_032546, partial [Lithocarpus litseifolius]